MLVLFSKGISESPHSLNQRVKFWLAQLSFWPVFGGINPSPQFLSHTRMESKVFFFAISHSTATNLPTPNLPIYLLPNLTSSSILISITSIPFLLSLLTFYPIGTAAACLLVDDSSCFPFAPPCGEPLPLPPANPSAHSPHRTPFLAALLPLAMPSERLLLLCCKAVTTPGLPILSCPRPALPSCSS